MFTNGLLRRACVVTALSALAIVGACETADIYSPDNQIYVVHAVLDPSADEQYVVLQQTTGLINEQYTVSGATVMITTPAGKVLTATETKDVQRFTAAIGPKVSVVYRINLSDFGETLQFGARYSLRIKVPGAPDITGVTTIPDASGAPMASTMTDTLRRNSDTLRLAWKRAPLASRYQVTISSTLRTYATMTDTAATFPGDTTIFTGLYSQRAELFVAGVTCDAVVVAVDENYYRYYKPNADIISESSTAQLQNAIGVFGSVARVYSRKIFVK